MTNVLRGLERNPNKLKISKLFYLIPLMCSNRSKVIMKITCLALGWNVELQMFSSYSKASAFECLHCYDRLCFFICIHLNS